MKYWGRLATFYLLLVAIFGILLRYAFVNNLGFVFQFFKHTHSHVAFLGWVFNAVFILIIYFYFNTINKTIKWQFYLFQFSIVGMLLTFPFQGYAPLSIAFSTLHIIVSIWFYFSTLRKITGDDPSVKWVKLGAFYMVISNLGPLSLGPILMSHLKDSFIYHLSLQHYLHFQYNGWFVTVLIGLLIKSFNLRLKNDKLIFVLLGWSVIPLFFSTVALIEPHPLYYVIGTIGALAQLIGFVILVLDTSKSYKFKHPLYKVVLMFVACCFLLKTIFQLSIPFPSISGMITTSHNPVIGFLHLIFLGVISNGLLVLLVHEKFIKNDGLTPWAFAMFNMGVVLMVGLLFIQPFYVPADYFTWLFYSTIPIFLGVLLFNWQSWRAKIMTKINS